MGSKKNIETEILNLGFFWIWKNKIKNGKKKVNLIENRNQVKPKSGEQGLPEL